MNPTESQIQKSCVFWYRMNYRKYRHFLISIPNGAYLSGDKRKRSAQWSRLQSEGAMKGAPDLILFHPRAQKMPVLIEMKRPGGKQSEYQKTIEESYKLAGYQYIIVQSIDQFMGVTLNFFNE